MKSLRFRNLVIFAFIAIGLNVFNLTSWLKSHNEEEEVVASLSKTQMNNVSLSYIFDEDLEYSKSQNYINAAKAFNNKNYEVAISELKADLENIPNHAQSYFLLGKVYEDATFPDGKYLAKMVVNYEKYIELKPKGYWTEYAKLKSAQYYISIGLMQQNTEILDKAEKYLKTISQDSNEVRMALGAIYLDKNNFKQAIAEFEKSANLQPNELRLKYNSLGLAYIKTGRYGNAENVLKIAIKIEPDNKFAHNNLGFVYLRLKKYKEAKAQFREALNIDPKYKNAKDNLDWLDSMH